MRMSAHAEVGVSRPGDRHCRSAHFRAHGAGRVPIDVRGRRSVTRTCRQRMAIDPNYLYLGYADGQTITIDYLSADGRGERYPALAAECPIACSAKISNILACMMRS